MTKTAKMTAITLSVFTGTATAIVFLSALLYKMTSSLTVSMIVLVFAFAAYWFGNYRSVKISGRKLPCILVTLLAAVVSDSYMIFSFKDRENKIFAAVIAITIVFTLALITACVSAIIIARKHSAYELADTKENNTEKTIGGFHCGRCGKPLKLFEMKCTNCGKPRFFG